MFGPLARGKSSRLAGVGLAIQCYPITVSSASYEAALEYDRRRLFANHL
jgi:hypothetical protein